MAPTREEGPALVEALIERYLRSGLLDDKAYAEGEGGEPAPGAAPRRGVSGGKLAMKGLENRPYRRGAGNRR